MIAPSTVVSHIANGYFDDIANSVSYVVIALNSALLSRCELCDAARTTDPPPSPNADAASPRKRARPSAGKETKQAKAAHHRQVDRTNPSIRDFFSAVQ